MMSAQGKELLEEMERLLDELHSSFAHRKSVGHHDMAAAIGQTIASLGNRLNKYRNM